MERIPVIFDTDIGSDIDDAVALAYLLAQPRCEVLGITTVSGEPKERAKLASALCVAAGQPDIPVLSGCERPILGELKQPKASQAEALASWPHQTEFESGAAVEWMRRTIRERPGEITLMAVGPMTNLAMLFTIDPEIPKLLKQLVLMCGLFTTHLPWGWPMGTAEWNALNDPIATHIVYEAGARCPSHTSYGLDVTTWCRMPAEQVRKRFTGPVLEVVRSFAEVWFRHADEITFHDPLAVVSTFESDICQYQEGRVTVELRSQELAGLTRWQQSSEVKPHRIATEVNPVQFFEKYFAVAAVQEV